MSNDRSNLIAGATCAVVLALGLAFALGALYGAHHVRASDATMSEEAKTTSAEERQSQITETARYWKIVSNLANSTTWPLLKSGGNGGKMFCVLKLNTESRLSPGFGWAVLVYDEEGTFQGEGFMPRGADVDREVTRRFQSSTIAPAVVNISKDARYGFYLTVDEWDPKGSKVSAN